MVAEKSIGTLSVVGGDKPDFVQEVFRSKQIYGYQLEYGESLLWGSLLCVETPNPLLNFARGPLAPDEEDYLINPVTGGDYAYIPPGYDLLFKVVFCDFDQPLQVDIIILELGNYPFARTTYLPEEGPLQTSPVGTTKGDIVGVDNPMTIRIRVKNIGNDYATGRVQFGGFVKEGAYTWR